MRLLHFQYHIPDSVISFLETNILLHIRPNLNIRIKPKPHHVLD